MSLYDDVWDYENKRDKKIFEENMKYFKSLTDEEKFALMWRDYEQKHCRDYREVKV